MKKTKNIVSRKRMNKKENAKNLFFRMKDADGKLLIEGDTVALLADGIEMVDMDTLEDITGVITKFEDDCAIVSGEKYHTEQLRRIAV